MISTICYGNVFSESYCRVTLHETRSSPLANGQLRQDHGSCVSDTWASPQVHNHVMTARTANVAALQHCSTACAWCCTRFVHTQAQLDRAARLAVWGAMHCQHAPSAQEFQLPAGQAVPVLTWLCMPHFSEDASPTCTSA